MVVISQDEAYEDGICRATRTVSSYMKKVSPNEREKWLKELIQSVKQQKFYSKEALVIFARAQLCDLEQGLKILVETGDIEEGRPDEIIQNLSRKIDYAASLFSNEPICQNPKAELLPLLPVVSERAIEPTILIKLITSNGKIGHSLEKADRIINRYKEDPGNFLCYWIADVRIDELKCERLPLTLAEAIAYAFHNKGILSEFTLLPAGSRYKRARIHPEIYLRLADGYPIAHWAKRNYGWPAQKIAKPTCASRSIH
ncbi:MAG: hypothetical protein WC470_01045 [Candidatus Paceibacterota bacterium]